VRKAADLEKQVCATRLFGGDAMNGNVGREQLVRETLEAAGGADIASYVGDR
jgi:hypothetical protein